MIAQKIIEPQNHHQWNAVYERNRRIAFFKTRKFDFERLGDFKFQNSYLKSQTSNFKSQIEISNLKFLISNLQSQISNLQSQISNLKFKSQISIYKKQIYLKYHERRKFQKIRLQIDLASLIIDDRQKIWALRTSTLKF